MASYGADIVDLALGHFTSLAGDFAPVFALFAGVIVFGIIVSLVVSARR